MTAIKRGFSSTRSIYGLVFILVSIFLIVSQGCTRGAEQSIKNIETFTRLYGYVKYFYPGDEAAAMDWDRFAVYGVKQVEKARNPAELKKILEELFLPIAPALVIHMSSQKSEFSIAAITPPNPENMKVVAWQHYGLGSGSINSIYQSIRTNRETRLSVSPHAMGGLTACIDAAAYRGKQIKLKAAVKVAQGKAQMWLRVDRKSKKSGFFDNMEEHPIQDKQWNDYEIIGTAAEDADNICFGCFVKGPGQTWVDDFQLLAKEDDQSDTWKPIAIKNPGFEEDEEGKAPKEWNTGSGRYSYSFSFKVTGSTAAKGSKSLAIESQSIIITGPLKNFEQFPGIGEYIAKDLGSGLSCLMPIALRGTGEYTYPQSPKQELGQLEAAVKKEVPGELSAENLYVRLADITISWNIFQHFYPYFDVVKTDWKSALTGTLKSAYQDKTQKDFLKTMRKFIAKLRDGHGRVSLTGETTGNFLLPINWGWIEDQLVITDIFDDSLTNIHVGDVIEEINGVTAKEALEKKQQYISSATGGWKRFRSLNVLLAGQKDAEFFLKIKRDGKTYEETLHASFSGQEYYSRYKKDVIKSKEIEAGIYYLNLDVIPMAEIDQLMPELEKAKAIICDLRGYPKSNHGLINHLLKEKENSLWMWIPRIIYPDYEKVTYHKAGWKMQPKEPLLTARMVFIVDGRAISYAESYMGYIEGFQLATIVGQPTAGTNGNVNPITLPGGYQVSWTGMRVVKHDGSPHHGVGIIPHVRVERTIKGVKEGRDEFLEKALEIAKQ